MGKVSLLDVVPTKNEAQNEAAAAGRKCNTILQLGAAILEQVTMRKPVL